VDDGSTDGSVLVCQKYEHLPNVKFYRQDHLGVNIARWKGVQKSTGEWITFLDSDDYYLRNDAIDLLVSESEDVDIVFGSSGKGYEERKDLPDLLPCERFLEMQYARELSAGPWVKLFRRKLFTTKTFDESKNVKRAQDYLMNLELAVENKKPVRVFKHSIYYLREHPRSKRHTFFFSLDYCRMLTALADEIVKGYIPDHNLTTTKAMQRRFFFCEAISTNGFLSDASHPYTKETKKLLKQTAQITLIDRWLLSVSSPWAVKAVWNLRKVWMRLEHPSMILRDIKRLNKVFA
jgi:glycosyltransferase involved in cell wall biosynthesis